jgi:hypothetical protein
MADGLSQSITLKLSTYSEKKDVYKSQRMAKGKGKSEVPRIKNSELLDRDDSLGDFDGINNQNFFVSNPIVRDFLDLNQDSKKSSPNTQSRVKRVKKPDIVSNSLQIGIKDPILIQKPTYSKSKLINRLIREGKIKNYFNWKLYIFSTRKVFEQTLHH